MTDRASAAGLAASPAAREPARPPLRRPVAVIVSRFPLVTETFILRELEELERQGQPVVLVPLIRERPRVAHREARRWLRRAEYAPYLSLRVIGANLRAFLRDPARYAAVLGEIATGAAHSPNVLLRTLALFPKSVYLAGRLPELGAVHVHAHFATYPASAAMIVARLSGLPFSFTAHAHDVFVPWRRASLEQKVDRAAFVRAIAEHGRQHLVAASAPRFAGKVHVIHAGVRPEDYRLDSPRRDADPVLLCVAALKPYKGLAVLLEACQRLRQSGRRFRCEIVGDGPLRPAIERLRASMDLGSHVTLHGALPQHEVTALLARSRIAVAPSIVAPDGQMDGIPVALMEAMAAGRPVVASRISGVPELVEDGVTGLLTEPGHAGELAAAIQRLLDDPALAEALGRRGREKVARDFRLDRCVESLLAHIDSCEPSPAPHVDWCAEALDRILPGRPAGIRRVVERQDSTIVDVLAGGERPRELVLKIHAVRDGDRRPALERAEHECGILGRLRSLGGDRTGTAAAVLYTVPRVLGRAGTALLLERCEGTLLVDRLRAGRFGGRARRRALARDVWHAGRWLRLFQQRTLNAVDRQHPLQTLVEQACRDADASAAAGVLTARERARALDRIGRLARLCAARAHDRTVGQHGDYWPGNIFVAERSIAVIDFEGFREGLPYEDAAYFLAQVDLFLTRLPFRPLRRALASAFLDGYLAGEPLDGDMYAFCRLVKALGILANRGQASPAVRSGARQRALRAMVAGG